MVAIVVVMTPEVIELEEIELAIVVVMPPALLELAFDVSVIVLVTIKVEVGPCVDKELA